MPAFSMAAVKRSRVGRWVRLIKAIGGFASGSCSGVLEFYRNGAISHRNWDKLLWAHCASNGRLTSLLTPLLSILRPPHKIASVCGLLGNFSTQDQKEIVSKLRRDGVFVFSQLMPAEICDAIERLARNTPAIIESNRDLRQPLEKYDPSCPRSRTYKLRESDIIFDSAIQRLMSDPVFAAVSEQYLRTQPAIGGVDVWWSAIYGNEPGSDAAQLFHFDFDAPPAWLKLFVYVSDVGPENGPHVYVKCTHKAAIAGAREFRARGYERIRDDEIELAFGKDAIAEICGPRGTVFMADTRGFHKGKMPRTGDRLLAQLIYCSSVFNDHGTAAKLPANLDPMLAAALETRPYIYERFR